MKDAHSISTRRAYGVQRVCRVWHRARSSVYAAAAGDNVPGAVSAAWAGGRRPGRRAGRPHPADCSKPRPFTAKGTGKPGRSSGVAGIRTSRRAPEYPVGRQVRFIPACAGERVSSCPRSSVWHGSSRVCGERGIGPTPARSSRGSSPRVRGTVGRGIRRMVRLRFIPACAGNGSTGTARPRIASVHPRVCGERSAAASVAWCDCVHPRVCGDGSTGTARPRIASVHPRVCGERSPRHPSHVRLRFIPACAGNGSTGTARPRIASVHPRVCGERDAHR